MPTAGYDVEVGSEPILERKLREKMIWRFFGTFYKVYNFPVINFKFIKFCLSQFISEFPI
jgi:hypothetical protein